MNLLRTLLVLCLGLCLGNLQYVGGITEEPAQSSASVHDTACIGETCGDPSKPVELPSNLYSEVKNSIESPGSETVEHEKFLDKSESGIGSDSNIYSVDKSEDILHDNKLDYGNSEREEQRYSADRNAAVDADDSAQEKDSLHGLSQDSATDGDYVTESVQFDAVFPQLEVIGSDIADDDSDSDNDSSGDSKETSEQEADQTPPRRRFFPLLYTFRTLFSSLLSEFGEDGGNQDGAFNSSGTNSGNLTSSEELIKDLNATINGTDAGKKTRFQCSIKNITIKGPGEVKIVNSTELLEILNSSKNQKVSTCVLVMFYAPWCHFCARSAPHYNALARAFPQLDVLAVDTSHFSYLNARFGTVAVPNVMLFHARSAVRFNHTTRVLENFIQFVTNNTGLEPDKSVKLEPTDFVGPLPSVVVRGRDWLLWLAWAFVIMCSTYGFVRSRYGQSFITRLRVLWQEHQHIE